MGSTVSTVLKYQESTTNATGDEIIVPLKNLNEQLRIFQHTKSGEVMVLINHDAIVFLKEPSASEYQEIPISMRGNDYLDHLKMAVSYPKIESFFHSNIDGLGTEIDPLHPNRDHSISTQTTEKSSRADISVAAPSEQAKNEPRQSLTSDDLDADQHRQSPHADLVDYNADAKTETVLLNGPPPSHSPPPKYRSGSKATDYRKVQPVSYLPPFSQRPKALSSGEISFSYNNANMAADSKAESVARLRSSSKHEVASQVQPASRRRSISADSGAIGIACSNFNVSYYNGNTNSNLPDIRCTICSEQIYGAVHNTVIFDNHVSSCTMRQEMKKELQSIDENLKPKLTEIKEESSKALSNTVSHAVNKAIEIVEHSTNLHDIVRKLIWCVMGIHQDSSIRKIDRTQAHIERYIQELKNNISALASDIGTNTNSNGTALPNDFNKIQYNEYNYLLKTLVQALEWLMQKKRCLVRYQPFLINVDNYDFLRLLGKGSFASVYLARRTDTKQLHAVKVMDKAAALKDGNLYEQILKERKAMAMASRYTDYYVNLACSFQTKDNLFLVMEYMQGGDCLSLLGSVKRLPEEVAQHFIAQVCTAVQHLHAHGVIHRDIKPDNVMITSRGHAKLGDFGSVLNINNNNSNSSNNNSSKLYKGDNAEEEFQRMNSSSKSSNISGNEMSNMMARMEVFTTVHRQVASTIAQHGSSSSSSSNSNKSDGVPVRVSIDTSAASIGGGGVARRSYSNASAANSGVSFNSCWLEDESSSSSSTMHRQSSSEEEEEDSKSHSNSNNWSSDSNSSLFFPKAANNTASSQQAVTSRVAVVGNYFYASPEMASGICVYNRAIDWWAVGVLLFHFITGTTPFEGLTKASTLENIECMQCDWEAVPRDISTDCIDFLRCILLHKQETRLGTSSSKDVLRHPFFSTIDLTTLYDGYGPYFPQTPNVDENNKDFYCFTLLSEQESLEVPDFKNCLNCRTVPGDADEEEEGGGNHRNNNNTTPYSHVGCNLTESEVRDLFADFNYHP